MPHVAVRCTIVVAEACKQSQTEHAHGLHALSRNLQTVMDSPAHLVVVHESVAVHSFSQDIVLGRDAANVLEPCRRSFHGTAGCAGRHRFAHGHQRDVLPAAGHSGAIACLELHAATARSRREDSRARYGCVSHLGRGRSLHPGERRGAVSDTKWYATGAETC